MLEETVAIGKAAFGGAHLHPAPALDVPGRKAVEAIGQLDAVGADVLHRCGPDRARDQGQVLQPVPAIVDAGRDETVPILARRGFDDPGVGALPHQAHARQAHLRHQAVDAGGQHHVAAAAQHHQLAKARRQRRQRRQLRGLGQRDKGRCVGRQAQGVETTQILRLGRQGRDGLDTGRNS